MQGAPVKQMGLPKNDIEVKYEMQQMFLKRAI